VNSDPIIQYYNRFDEWGRLDREPLELNMNWHYMSKYLPPAGHVLDNGAGPGKYALKLAECGYDVTVTDLTPRLLEMAKSKAEEQGLLPRFRAFHTANATDLGMLSDEQFDAALMLGPLYHLQDDKDRTHALQELYRVTKRDGIVFVAFMSRMRHAITALAQPHSWRPTDTVEALEAFLHTGKFNHVDEGRFTGAYYYPIEEIKPFMEAGGFETLHLIGSSSIAGSLSAEQTDYWLSQDEKSRDKWWELLASFAESEYGLGFSSHLMYIGRRK
jgi:ubiquinone/menaquinone biosynthesis C-methylase UbiE